MAKLEKEKLVISAKNIGGAISKIAGTAAGSATKAARTTGSAITKAGSAAVQKAAELKEHIPSVSTEDVLGKAMKIPFAKVNREKFLRKELIKYYPEETVVLAIEKNPAFAGVVREKIDEIANQVINYETNKVTSGSFIAGLPGGLAMIGTIPMDVMQYFTFILRATQKLAYLYGFPEFDLSEEDVSDETLNQMLVFLGVMYGVQGANQAVKAIAEVAAKKITKSLAKKALTKTAVYPIVKKVATTVGVHMTKQIFAESVGKVVPVVGGVISGGISYATFKPCCKKLKKSFMELKLSDPEYYKNYNMAEDIEK